MPEFITQSSRQAWRPVAAGLAILMAAAGCDQQASEPEQQAAALSSTAQAADSDAITLGAVDAATGIQIAKGFKATVFVDHLEPIRHIAVRDNGDVYAAVNNQGGGSGIYVLRDGDGDRKAERVEKFDDIGGTGIGFHDGYLYRTSDTAVYRWKLKDGEFLPESPRETVVDGFIEERQHAAKSITFDDQGHVYVNVGAPANTCQEKMRTAGSPGKRPCPLLERYGGIWRFDASKTGQTQVDDGYRFASGFRNSIALSWNPGAKALYLVQHGRDQLKALWPAHYDDAQNAELPSEEFMLVEDGVTYGWPYTYYDHQRGQRMVGPEYGGDGKTPAEAGQYPDPVMAFPGHWAPNGLMFYTGDQFPARYKNGAFIAFHGSWNRAPLKQGGYKVVFVPFDGKTPSGPNYVFADGFAGKDPLMNPGNATHRPMGLAQGPGGEIYIGDSVTGRIWRIDYVGS